MKNFERCRSKFGMTLAVLIAGLVLASVFASCKGEVVTEYVDKKADEAAPAPVTNLTATAKDGCVLLTWTDAADSDIYGYEVSYSGSKAINRAALSPVAKTA